MLVSKYFDRVGSERATGRLESWTSMYAAVRPNRDSLRVRVDSSGLMAPNIANDIQP